jgi:hypothetical protein
VGARGLAPAPLRRAAKYADVWHPVRVTPEELRQGGDQIDAMAGRKVARSIRLNGPDDVRDQLLRYRDAGCFQAAIDFKAESLPDLLRQAEKLIVAPI